MSAATTSAAGRLTDAELKAQEKAARKAESTPMTAPEARPALAVNTRRMQLTRVPVMSCCTLKGPKMVAMLGMRLPRNWATTTRAMPIAVYAIHLVALLFMGRYLVSVN